VPRPATGQVVERVGADGTVYRSLRFRAYGKRHQVALGAVTRVAADRALAAALAEVQAGVWQPQASAPAPAPPEAPAAEPSFHELAEQWYLEREPELSPNTRQEYKWRLECHLLPFFGAHQLSAITVAEVDRYKAAKLGEKPPLAASSINKTLQTLAAVLEVAVERDQLTRNPAAGRRRRVRARAPRRFYLDTADHIAALLDAAGQIDADARDDRRFARRALLAALVFGGLRIGEALDLRWRDVDLAAGRLRIVDAKTPAGVRYVPLLPALRDELLSHHMESAYTDPNDVVFANARGHRQLPEHVRNRTLVRAMARANQRLGDEGRALLPEGLTPHSLRHTYISLRLALGDDLAAVAQAVGHVDTSVTHRVYTHLMALGDDQRARLRALVDGEWAHIGHTNAGREPAGGESDDPEDAESPALAGLPGVRLAGFEPAASCSGGKRSIH